MSLPHALLGLINYRPATGDELKATFDRSIHFFWNATLPQIYRTLNQMEKRGWLTLKVEHQNGKPSRKLYDITKAGRDHHANLLQRYEEEVPSVIQGYADATGAFADASYWTLTLDYGRRVDRMVLERCNEALKRTEDKSGKRPRQKKSVSFP